MPPGSVGRGGSPSTVRIAFTPQLYQAIARSLLVTGDLEAERRDAEELLRRGEHAHARDAKVAQDLGANAIGAEHRAARGIGAAVSRARADDVLGQLLRPQHDDDTVRLERDAPKRCAETITETREAMAAMGEPSMVRMVSTTPPLMRAVVRVGWRIPTSGWRS